MQRITQLCCERGLIAISAGTYGNVIRTLMPLVITEEQLEEGLDILEGAILDAAHELMPASAPAASGALPGLAPASAGSPAGPGPAAGSGPSAG